MLSELGEKVPEGDKTTVEAAAADLKSVLESEDKDAIKSKIDALAQASMKLGEAMYQTSQGAAGGEAPPESGGGPDDKVVDVDFEEVKDDDDKKSA